MARVSSTRPLGRTGTFAALLASLAASALLSACGDSPSTQLHAGIYLSQTSLSTTEGGAGVSFDVGLTTPPTDLVYVTLTVNDSSEGQIRRSGSAYAYSSLLLTFTPADWNVAQTIVVMPVDDATQDGNVTYAISVAGGSYDPAYAAVPARTISVTNVDDDIPGITVSKSATSTTEAGSTDTFTVRLNTLPTATVTIPVTSTDTSEGLLTGGNMPSTPSPSISLTFTTANWSAPQTVTVYGQGDLIDDGNQTFTVTIGQAAGAAEYAALLPQTVAATNVDDDAAGITVAAAAQPLLTSENGTTATFTVRLNTQPVADVIVAVTSGDAGEGLLSAAGQNGQASVNLTFTSVDWSNPQTVTVTGVDEAGTQVPGDNVTYAVTVGPATGDAPYAALASQTVSVLNTDNDTPTVVVPAVATGLQTSETGAANTRTFTVGINKLPASDVVIRVTSNDVSEGLVMGGSSPAVPAQWIDLTFTPVDFQTAQTVTVVGQVDNTVDGAQAYDITIGTPTGDAQYTSVPPQLLAVTNADTDTAGFTKSKTSFTVNEGATNTFTVVLNRAPVADVIIPVSSANPLEAKVSGGSIGATFGGSLDLTFTSGNWQTPQTVTVRGETDQVDDGDKTVTLTVGPTSSSSAPYSGLPAQTVTVTCVDVDVAGFLVAPMSGLTVSEAGTTAAFTVQLATKPMGTVTIPVSPANSAQVLVASGGGATNYLDLTFTASDWDVPKTVTVSAVNDAVQDGTYSFSIAVGATASGDPKYQGLAAKQVTGIALDDDATNQGSAVTPIDITGALPYASQVGSGSSYYMLTGLPAGSLILSLNSVQGDVSLFVYGNSNFSSQLLCSSASPGTTAGETCTTSVTAGATVYIRVDAVAPTTGATFTIVQPTTFAETEPNDSIGTADGTVSGDVILAGGIPTSYEVDYYAIFNPGASAATVSFETFTGSIGACTGDTTLTLYNSGGGQVAYDDESGIGSCSYLTYSIPAGTTYYLKVAGWASYTVPSYLVQVNFP